MELQVFQKHFWLIKVESSFVFICYAGWGMRFVWGILIGSISLILMQATIHIGVNIRLFPTTGMTLPFLSYGGSSIISTSILAGIILNLTKRKIN